MAKDFCEFILINTDDLYNRDAIVKSTWTQHKCKLTMLLKFIKAETLLIDRLNIGFIERFDVWARTKYKVGYNTTCGYHKDIKTPFACCREVPYHKKTYDDFSFAYVERDQQAFNQNEINSILKLFKNPLLESNDQEILLRFYSTALRD